MATVNEPIPFVWTRERYELAGEAGVFGDLRVELVDGEVVQMSPKKARHAAAIVIASRLLESAFGAPFHARAQLPLVLSDRSEPEPDVAIVVGRPQDYIQQHPHVAELVVEVSESTLLFDRAKKARLYASAGIREFWLINLQDNQIEVFREPNGNAGYGERLVLKRGEVVSPIGARDAKLSVDELLA
jgi:Uma2 family endonuclease